MAKFKDAAPPSKKRPEVQNGGRRQLWVMQEGRSQKSDLDHILRRQLRVRSWIAGVLVLLAFSLAWVIPARAVDPGKGWIIIEPIAGLLLFWPLSRVMIRVAGLTWGCILSLIPAVILVCVRLYGSERDSVYGMEPNLSFGAMIFLGVCTIAAYLLFRTPPRQ